METGGEVRARDDGPRGLTGAELAWPLRINRETVREQLHRGALPGGHKLGDRIIRFHRDTVLDWLAGKGCVSRSRRKS